MMKSSMPVIVVDSVEKAVKFYTEKLGFDIDSIQEDRESKHILRYVSLRKGKSYIAFRTPVIEELAEFSFIKRVSTRGVGIYIVMKKGLDKYYERCDKKRVMILSVPEFREWGERTFSIRDPFGVKVTFAEPVEGFQHPAKRKFVGLEVNDSTDETMEDMIRWLKGFGILRRAAKKYSKIWIRDVFGIKKTG